MSEIESRTEWATENCPECDGFGCAACDGRGDREVSYRACVVCNGEVERCGNCGEEECNCSTLCTCSGAK